MTNCHNDHNGHNDEQLLALLSGSQQVPANASSARGKVKVTLKRNSIIVKGKFSGLSSALQPVANVGAAHIHLGEAGINGPVVFELHPILCANGTSGRFNERIPLNVSLVEVQRAAFLAGRYYINIHTVTYPAGEIRGQILVHEECGTQYVAALSARNQSVPTASSATGTILAALNGKYLYVSGAFTGLSSDFRASHIHSGAAGVVGPVLFTLNVESNLPPLSGKLVAANNTFKLTKAQYKLLKHGELYVNVHTVNFPNGEIRAQLLKL